jgi:hypothetical protein
LTRIQCTDMTSEEAIPDAPAPIAGMGPIVLYLGKRYNLTLLEAEQGGHRYTVSKGPIEFAKSSESFPADEAGWRDAWTRLNEVDRDIWRDSAYERASKVEPIPDGTPRDPAPNSDKVWLVFQVIGGIATAVGVVIFSQSGGGITPVLLFGIGLLVLGSRMRPDRPDRPDRPRRPGTHPPIPPRPDQS